MTKQMSNKEQLAELVKIMENDPALAKGILQKNMRQQRWEIITEQLNSLGPPAKSWEKWYRVWIDMKAKVKSKMGLSRTRQRTAFGNVKKSKKPRSIDVAVENLIESKHPMKREYQDLERGCMVRINPMAAEVEAATTSTAATMTTTMSPDSDTEKRVALIEKQMQNQEIHFEKILEETKKVTCALLQLTAQQNDFFNKLIDLKKAELEEAKKYSC